MRTTWAHLKMINPSLAAHYPRKYDFHIELDSRIERYTSSPTVMDPSRLYGTELRDLEIIIFHEIGHAFGFGSAPGLGVDPSKCPDQTWLPWLLDLWRFDKSSNQRTNRLDIGRENHHIWKDGCVRRLEIPIPARLTGLLCSYVEQWKIT
jgi:hypothetical protein